MRKGVPKEYNNVVENMYEGPLTSVKSMRGETEDFWV